MALAALLGAPLSGTLGCDSDSTNPRDTELDALGTTSEPVITGVAPMITARGYHTATVLANGKVLVAGGATNPAVGLTSAELYDPATNVWSPAGAMATPRSSHTATLLPNGKVLVAGGYNAGTTSELYDPATNTWSSAGALVIGRHTHTATLLASGKVLVAGGYTGSSISVGTGELYDPATNSWTTTGPMNVPRVYHVAASLADGRVLVTAGYNTFAPGAYLKSAEIYNPVTNTWSVAAPMSENRTSPTATTLANGKVLVTGSYPGSATAEIYDAVTNTWSAAAPMSATRYSHVAMRLLDGKVLVAGGATPGGANIEVYDPAANAWSSVGAMSAARYLPGMALLPDGRALITGGGLNGGYLASSDLDVPPPGTRLIQRIVYSDTFTLSGARTDGLYNDNSAGAYAVENAPASVWTPFTNFSFNTPQSSISPSLPVAASGDPGAGTGLAQSGGGDFSFSYNDPSNNYVVQADAILPDDRFDISSLPFAGATIYAGSSLSVFFRRDGSNLPGIGLFNGAVETSTACTTGVHDNSWHNFAVNFDQITSHVRMFVDGDLRCDKDLTSFVGGIYKSYSKAAVGMGGTWVTWMDNFQAGPGWGTIAAYQQPCTDPRPHFCLQNIAPVCGTMASGLTGTYSNDCQACADASVVGWSPGACNTTLQTQ